MLQQFHIPAHSRASSKTGFLQASITAIVVLTLAACSAGDPVQRVDRQTLDQAANISSDMLQTELGLAPQTASKLGMIDLAPPGTLHRLNDQSQASFERARLIRIELLTRLNRRPVMPSEHPMARDLDILANGLAHLTELQKIGHGHFAPNQARPYAIDPFAGIWIDGPYLLLYDHSIANLEDAEAWLDRLNALAPAYDDTRRRFVADAAIGLIPPQPLLAETKLGLDTMQLEPAIYDELLLTFESLLLGAPEIEAETAEILMSQAKRTITEHLLPAHAALTEAVARQTADAPQLPGIQSQPLGYTAWQSLLQWYAPGLEAVEDLHAQHVDLVAGRLAAAENARSALTTSLADTEPVSPAIDAASLPAETPILRVAERVVRIGPRPFLVTELVPPSLDGMRPALALVHQQDLLLWPAEWQAVIRALPQHEQALAYATARHDSAKLNPARFLFETPAFALGWTAYVANPAGNGSGTDLEGSVRSAELDLLIAALATLDTGIHTQRWTSVQSAEYLQSVLRLSPELSHHLTRQISANPGRASASLYGQNWFRALESRARAVLNDRFDITDFQNVLLQGGPRPFAMVERDIERWYEGQISR